ncbi:unnamed protein product [Effrenium voratum]|nr:unnamed protein product [Effrenium voratum]
MGQSRPSVCQCCTATGIGDELSLMPPRKRQDTVSRKSMPQMPEWMKQMAPGVDGEEALQVVSAWEQFKEDLTRRTKAFVESAASGLPCRVAEPGHCAAAVAALDFECTTLTVTRVEEGDQRAPRVFRLADLRNLWLCSDSELARRAHCALSPFALAEEAELACLVLLDGSAKPLALVLRSSEAREDFLDCMAVLIAAQRREDAEPPAWLPKPDPAGLRPYGCSLRSCHLTGPLGAWLASCAPAARCSESPGKGFKAGGGLRELLERDVGSAGLPLLRFLSCCPLSLRKLRSEDQLQLGGAQFAVQAGPSEELAFARLRGTRASSFGLHGSPLRNWYSILRNGLQVLSNSELMGSGARFGPGIYLAERVSTARHYCNGFAGSRYDAGLGEALQLLAVVEYVDDPLLRKRHSEGIVTVSDHAVLASET